MNTMNLLAVNLALFSGHGDIPINNTYTNRTTDTVATTGNSLSAAMFKMLGYFMELSPLGVMSLMAYSVAQYGAGGTCITATDTSVVSEDGTAISEIPDRSRLHQMQTPQSFRPLKLKALMDSLTPDEEAVLTDGCKIYLLKGEPVAMVPGAVTNIKITYPSDLAFAEAFLKGEEDA